MSGFAEIDALVKRRYLTGDYGNAHLKVTPRLWGRMRADIPSSGTGDTPRLGQQALGDILGIPIVVDFQLPPSAWRLVDNSTGRVLHEGTIPPPAVSEEAR